MKKFILLLHEDAERLESLSPKDMEQMVQDHFAYAKSLQEKGCMLSGDGLDPAGKQISTDEMVIKDGPYVESKFMLGGYYLINAPDMDAALELARSCPCHHWGGTTEVRAIMDYDQ